MQQVAVGRLACVVFVVHGLFRSPLRSLPSVVDHHSFAKLPGPPKKPDEDSYYVIELDGVVRGVDVRSVTVQSTRTFFPVSTPVSTAMPMSI